MKAFEGMAAYDAGIKEGRKQMIEQFGRVLRPTALNMIALIIDQTEEDWTEELANDVYNYLSGIDFEILPVMEEVGNGEVQLAEEFRELFKEG